MFLIGFFYWGESCRLISRIGVTSVSGVSLDLIKSPLKSILSGFPVFLNIFEFQLKAWKSPLEVFLKKNWILLLFSDNGY